MPIGIGMCGLLKGCGGSPAKPQGGQLQFAQPDVILRGSETELAEQVRGSYSRLNEIAKDTRRSLRIGFYIGERMEVLRMHFCDPKEDVANYKHVRIVKESTGEAIRLVWGWDGIKPAIRFVNDEGKLLVVNGNVLEFQITGGQGKLAANSIDWLSLGAKWLAVGFAIWLGAQVAKLIVSAVAFLAFSAMVIGALMMAVGIIKPILELTGWTFDDVKSFIGRAIEELANALLEGAEFIRQALSGLAG